MTSYPKKGRSDISRTARPQKRRFQGNQFTSADEDTAETSASARKLLTASSEDIRTNPLHTYRIIEFATVFLALSEILVCRQCKQAVSFEDAGHRGLGFKIIVTCRCGRREINSGPFIHTGYEINRRIVLVMRLLGIGRNGINLFCNVMDICSGLSESSYNKIVHHIHSAAKSVFDFTCKKAVEEEKEKNSEQERPLLNLKVSGDGSWKKRGFKSLYGVTTLIGYYSGKVIDLVVKSSYCQGCTFWKNKTNTDEYCEWFEVHEEQCTKNHEGSAGKMEVDAIKEMFSRSEDKYGVKYGNYIGDGDSKTFKAILDLNPYGDEFQVLKSECVGHVEKRMGSRLRNVKKAKKLGGRGRLTDSIITKLTKYYGLAIRRNVNSVEGMRKDIMATIKHIFSTKENPDHGNCPSGADSWCKWQKAVAQGKDPTLVDLTPPLNQSLKEHLLPIYEDLSKEDLLQRCLGGHTQNANESFNSTIWLMTPKHLHSGKKIVEISSFIAAGVFNEGYSSILRMMNDLDIRIGTQCRIFAENVDRCRIERQNQRSLFETKQARLARKQKLLEDNANFDEAEGLFYAPGIAD